MAEQPGHYSDQHLADALRALGARVVYPPVPDMPARVRRELEASPTAPREPWWTPLLRRKLATIAAAVLLLAALAVAAIPDARTTVAGWLSLPGVTIVESPKPAVENPRIGRFFLIGVPRTLDQAREEAEFDILLPALPGLEEPDEVWFDRNAVGGTVSFVYYPTAEIPESAETGAGLLISQFLGELNPNMFGKGVGPGVSIETISVNGEQGLWIEGDPHSFSYTDPSGDTKSKPTRLAGNTLLWHQGELTLRLESALDRDSAVAIAESMR